MNPPIQPNFTAMHAFRRNMPVYLLLALFLLIAIMPLIAVMLTSFKTPAELNAGPFAMPQEWRWQNYVDAWNGARFSAYFRSSVIVVIPVVVISVVFSTMAGYAFGMLRVPGEKVLLLLILLGLSIPTEAIIIPLWDLTGQLGLRNSYWAVIFPQIAMSFSFGTFWMQANFRTFPRELLDAAIVDGCNTWSVLWYILFPLSRPALLSLTVLLFMWTWNEFLLVLVLVTGDMRTLPVGLALLRGQYESNVSIQSAAAMIVSLPVVIVYFMFQRNFIRGMTSGAFKG
jgi:raffinose/stachyose/melibiose transport system permease protein